ncbi:MAG: ABC transporter permease [Candidatus Caldatribacteriota bacterium]
MNKLRFLMVLAAKYIFRNKARSFFILTSITVSLIVAMIILSLFSGLFSQIKTSVTNTNTGNFQLQELNFSESQDPMTPLAWSDEFAGKLSQVEGYSPELILEGNIVQPEGSASLFVLGIDPERNLSVIDLGHHIIEGDFLESDTKGIVIGKELAEKFKLQVGDDFLLNYQDIEGELRSELLPITGIYDFNSKEFKKTYVYIHQKKWQELYFNEVSDQMLFHRIVIKTQDDFTNPFPKLDLKSWKDINPEMAVVIDFNKGLLNFFMIIIAITVSLSIFNPIRMLLEERLSEFKMMNVIGVSHKTLLPLGLFEALIMMTISLTLSLVVYFTLTSILASTGVDLTMLNEGKPIERAGIEMPNVIYPVREVRHIILSLLFVMITIGFTYSFSLHAILKKIRGGA